MSRKVAIADRAYEELDAACAWWSEHRSPEQALRWYNGFVRALRGLADTYGKCGLATENEEFPFEIRQMTYGLDRKATHRAIFTIRPDLVLVLRVRHLAQEAISPED
jgi:plasmid stabilization system protein ParE